MSTQDRNVNDVREILVDLIDCLKDWKLVGPGQIKTLDWCIQGVPTVMHITNKIILYRIS